MRVPPREWLTLLHVLTVVSVVEVLIRWVPLPKLSRLLGIELDLSPATQARPRLPSRELPTGARRQLRWTSRVVDAWPFSSGPCLRRSLAAGHLLRHDRPALRLGVAGTGDDIRAHAWLEIDGRPLEAVDDYTPFQDIAGIAT
jgi:hypothetical protein